jgi:hypothetical protein
LGDFPWTKTIIFGYHLGLSSLNTP